ncbi:MAG: 4Fe-4S dicluster domain-containing protein [bacterium]
MEFLSKVTTISGEPFKTCMQCGTCSVVCPMEPSMQITTRQFMLLAQWGQKESLLSVNTAWVCASCHGCEVRCPRGIDIPRVMESVRQMTLRENENYVQPGGIDKDQMDDMPQIALVSSFRKHTS